MRYTILFLLLITKATLLAQEMIGSQLLDKAIAFHDPNNHWSSFQGSFQVKMETPSSSDRLSKIHLDFPKSIFELQVSKDSDRYTYKVHGDTCEISLNGSTNLSKEDREKFRLSCERGNMYRDYYAYLYGLPMKLKDKGTYIDDKVTKTTFKNKTYLKLKVTYDTEVGDDIWYFYFNPETYAMEVYQFFHDESKNDGEYILLSGLEDINGMQLPKTRKWYYNKDDKFLGVDILN